MWELFNFQIETSSNLFDKLNISSSDQLSEFRTVAENYAKVSASHVGASTVGGMGDHFEEEVKLLEG